VLARDAARGDHAGEIVVTDLKNLAMPMIRYRTRDVGTMKSAPCACGRGLPLLDLSGGRVTDFLSGVDGTTKVSGIVLATYVITNLPGVRQIQFVQQHTSSVRVRLVRGPAWSEESRTTLVSRIRSFLGEAMQVDVDYVPEIPLEASGKYRFSISKVGN
jgi:phenylacetate-CoA ligase